MLFAPSLRRSIPGHKRITKAEYSRKFLLALSLILMLPVISSAQSQTGRSITTDSALAATLAGIPGQPLTLNEARELAIKNSTEILTAQALVNEARGTARRERGGFDPTLFAELIKSKTETPASSPFAGANALNEESTDLRTGINWRLRYGTELEFSLNSNKLKSNSGFASLNPQYTAFTRLDITQPLLSRSWQAAKAPVTAAERVEEAAIARYRDVVLALIQSVDETYWDLYAAERDLAVLRITLEQAETFFERGQDARGGRSDRSRRCGQRDRFLLATTTGGA
jgi:outer membrane protein TolC